MSWDRGTPGWRGWLLPAATLALIAAALAVWLGLDRPRPAEPPPQSDCSLIPSRYLTGTFIGWQLGRVSPDGGGEISARVRLDDGRDIVAYNATSATIERDMRVTVSEIVCVHRTIFLLTEFGAGAPAPPVR
ncbi:MAG: hypothetical protein AB1749_06810 [Pseudomonadota bacterium]